MASKFLSSIWQPEHTKAKTNWLGLFLGCASAIVLALVFLLRLKVLTNDDVFTYFNYARNMAEGRFFAIDYRNIPGEGFSSTLYMLLLVPFHLLGLNPMLGGVMLNFAALFATAVITAQIFKSIFDFSALGFSVAFGIIGSLYLRNPDVIGIAGWAFETLYSPLIFSVLLLVAVRVHKEENAVPRHFVVVLLFMLGLLVRPENVALYLPAVAFYALAFWGQWRSIVKLCLYFLIALSGLAWAKWSIFHDFFPTGYYRKFSNIDYGVSSGADYLLGWYFYHSTEIIRGCIFLVGIAVLALATGALKAKGAARTTLLLCLVLLATIAINIWFCTKSTPLVGFHFRYLILSNYSFVFLGAFGILLILKSMYRLLPLAYRESYRVACFSLVLAFPLLMLNNSIRVLGGITNARQKIDVEGDTEKQVAMHPYLRFGRYLRAHIPNHEKLTISMGDGGAVPYAAQCNTIDPAGLTEPFVAHLAAYPNADRWKIYHDYIESYKPDLVVVIMGTIGNENDTTDSCYPFSHLPVPNRDYVHYLSEIGKSDYNYISSVRSDTAGAGMPYDIHLCVRKDSPMASQLIKTCQDYSSERGYTMVGNYTIACEGIVAVLPKYRK